MLSSIISNYATDWRSLVGTRDVQTSPEHCITILEYAHDVFLIADNYDEMQIMLNNMSATIAKAGFTII